MPEVILSARRGDVSRQQHPNVVLPAPSPQNPAIVPAFATATSPNMSGDEFVVFQRWVATSCGLSLGEDKKYLLETRLARLLQEYQCDSFMDLYRKVSNAPDPQLRDRIVDAVTTHETLWFRDETLWAALRERVLPELVVAHPSGPIRIWSAGCSTGQEPYSLAMLIDDWCNSTKLPGAVASRFEIVATDVSAPALVLAMSGRYDPISMKRGLVGPFERFRSAYFTASGTTGVISPEIRKRVQFVRHSLQDSFSPIGAVDLVLMRYVTIYFSPEFKLTLWPRVHNLLRPFGVLMLGAAETLLGHEQLFRLERHERAYFYRVNKSEPGGI